MSELSDAVLRTLAYAKVFGNGVRFHEWERFLLSAQLFSSLEIKEMSEHLLKQGKTQKTTRKPETVLWRRALLFRTWASWIPWIQSVWVTGSLAVDRARSDDDVDFMIVTDPNRLWISRFLIVGIGFLFGRVRTRFRANQVSWPGYWCLNLWLEAGATLMPEDQQNVYTAREVVQAIPLYRRQDVQADQFLLNNSWVRLWSLSGWSVARSRARSLPFSPRAFPASVLNLIPEVLVTWVNRQAWKLQGSFLARHQTRERVLYDRAFFHPRDTKRHVESEYERICAVLGVSPWPSAHKH